MTYQYEAARALQVAGDPAASLPYLKRLIRSVDTGSCEQLARTACSFDSDRQVTAYVRDQARKIIPESISGRPTEDGLTF